MYDTVAAKYFMKDNSDQSDEIDTMKNPHEQKKQERFKHKEQ